MKRLYYLTSNIDSADLISTDLHKEGVSDWRFHIMTKDEAGLYHHHLHGATPFHRYDIIHRGEQGALIGITAGLVANLVLLLTGVADSLGLFTMLLLTTVFAMFGAWVGGLVGLAHDHYKIERFKPELAQGKYLVMVDVKKAEEEKVRQAMKRYHPEATLLAADSPFSNPFVNRITAKASN
ncbi:hypothetical protein [Spartinivicinus poritis]|uniref:DUF1269 domain-containing protein n=1 Tax=Spartinivicinus poritis TaxID=2994640 RepID=A0ABT5U967_9GAMM|nr:hypothetical protein [Spartinivicinus sp. A2-2]MDE1462921.1 hypothetical protein [Spartinivicinus sp. A2-2]